MQVTLKSDDQSVQFWKGGLATKVKTSPSLLQVNYEKNEVAQKGAIWRSPLIYSFLSLVMSMWCDIHNQSAVCKEKSNSYANGQWLYNLQSHPRPCVKYLIQIYSDRIFVPRMSHSACASAQSHHLSDIYFDLWSTSTGTPTPWLAPLLVSPDARLWLDWSCSGLLLQVNTSPTTCQPPT